MRYRITAPVEGATCTVAGVALFDSVGETDSEAAVAYFERHGYRVDEIGPDLPVEILPPANDDPPAPVRPAKSASKEARRDYAKASGMDELLAAGMSRDDPAAHYEAQEAGK